MTPERHHLDRRIPQLIPLIEDGDPADLLNTLRLANLLGVSVGWLETGRLNNFGPPSVRIPPRKVRYRRADILDWLRGRQEIE